MEQISFYYINLVLECIYWQVLLNQNYRRLTKPMFSYYVCGFNRYKKIRYLPRLHCLSTAYLICFEEILKPTEEQSPINMLSNLFFNTTFHTNHTHALDHAQRCTPTQPSLTYIKAKLTASETYT